MHEHEELLSGKTIIREFDDDGRLAKEMHSYGARDIGITIELDGGTKVSEMYVVKQRLVSQKRYVTRSDKSGIGHAG